jgi:NAD+ kinase
MKVIVFENVSKLHAKETAEKTIEILKAEGAAVRSYSIDELTFVGDFLNVPGTDVIIVIGGDGTILKAARLAAENGIPLLGINTGRLGFMASIERTELELLSKLMTGDYTISERMRITAEIVREGEVVQTVSATNEIAAIRPLSKLTDFVVKAADNGTATPTGSDAAVDINAHTVCSFRADGVIIATPTGSTAYALANGGAIIEPNADCMELTPISAHSLSMRPMIFSKDAALLLTHEVPEGRKEKSIVTVNADGVHSAELLAGETLRIRRSSKPLRLIDLKPNVFYESVNGKLFQSLK